MAENIERTDFTYTFEYLQNIKIVLERYKGQRKKRH